VIFVAGSVVVMALLIVVISDVICPWCYVGKRRLERAIAALDGPHDVRVRWLPFQLNPTMPMEGISRREYRTKKFGSWERSLELDAKVGAVGKEEGIQFAFDRIERTPNTLDAHRLIGLADQEGVQGAVVEALFRAYFTEGRDIGNRQTLLGVVAGAGLNRPKAEGLLSGDDWLETVKEAEDLARRFRVEGVPFFVINGKLCLSGAQPPAVFLDAFMQASEVVNTSDQYDYVLRGGDQGAERLRLLAAAKWPTTKTLLDRAGLRRGMYCLDVGCGIGAVTLHMAEAVKPEGRVVGLDVDERCVALARLEAQRLGLVVEFRLGTATDLQETSAYDLVFGRFVLTHLREPEEALRRMVVAARPRGVVVVEDIQFTGHFAYPACAAFDRYVGLYQEAVRRNGGDPNIGPRLAGMFLDAGLEEVDLEVVQPRTGEGRGNKSLW
jgi:predicted DsbA family dithiol-disulfide isomerase/2-polyprenyl-3-methyl-5-hydroxy-6-metoxy-1,4-benzoquinol methylase